MPYVRGQLPESTICSACTIEVDSVSAPSDIIVRVARLIRTYRMIRQQDKIDLPVAITFSKLDAIKEILPTNLTILEESPHVKEGKYIKEDMLRIQEEIHGLLYEWKEEELLSQLNMNYKTYALFAVSALGNTPDELGHIMYPIPHRIEDPLLWILYNLRII